MIFLFSIAFVGCYQTGEGGVTSLREKEISEQKQTDVSEEQGEQENEKEKPQEKEEEEKQKRSADDSEIYFNEDGERVFRSLEDNFSIVFIEGYEFSYSYDDMFQNHTFTFLDTADKLPAYNVHIDPQKRRNPLSRYFDAVSVDQLEKHDRMYEVFVFKEGLCDGARCSKPFVVFRTEDKSRHFNITVSAIVDPEDEFVERVIDSFMIGS
jgi:hypothetical protein